MVVTPHPDDAEISCGGTVANWIRQGTSVYYVLCSDGSKGTEDPDMTPERLAKIRYEEQMEAAKTLGVKEVVALGYPDGELEDTREFRGHLVRALRRFRPEVVICPDPYRRSFYFHRDHRIVGQVTQDAVFPYARDRLHFPEHEAEGLAPHKTGTLMFWGPEEIETYVDISESMDIKADALQMPPQPAWRTRGRRKHRLASKLVRRDGEEGRIRLRRGLPRGSVPRLG